MENCKSMVFYSSFYEGINIIPKEQPELKLKMYDAILQYGLYDKEIEMDWQLRLAWEQIKAQIDANKRRRENGQKGGIQKAKNQQSDTKAVAKGSKSVANDSEDIANVNVNDNDNANENDNVYVNDNVNVNDLYADAEENNKAINYFLENIQPEPSQNVIKTINSYLDDGMTEDCLVAIFEYCKDNDKTGWAYIKKVIENKFSEGVFTLEDYKNSIAERRSRSVPSKPEMPERSKKKSSFHNFEEREIDIKEIEDQYFAWVKGEN